MLHISPVEQANNYLRMLTIYYSSANAVETPLLHFFSNQFDQTPVLTGGWFIYS
jgi:hypothetical protein